MNASSEPGYDGNRTSFTISGESTASPTSSFHEERLRAADGVARSTELERFFMLIAPMRPPVPLAGGPRIDCRLSVCPATSRWPWCRAWPHSGTPSAAASPDPALARDLPARAATLSRGARCSWRLAGPATDLCSGRSALKTCSAPRMVTGTSSTSAVILEG